MTRQGDASEGYTVDRYFGLVDAGLLDADDRVELLEGLIVAMPPQSPRHASTISRLFRALSRAIGDRAVIRMQSPFIAGGRSVPEPDATVVPGNLEDYDRLHPYEAMLAIEVSETSLPQDRLTKSRIYAGAGVIEYWIVNLRDDVIEIYRDPDESGRMYRITKTARRGERIEPVTLPTALITVDEILPSPPARDPGQGDQR